MRAARLGELHYIESLDRGLRTSAAANGRPYREPAADISPAELRTLAGAVGAAAAAMMERLSALATRLSVAAAAQKRFVLLVARVDVWVVAKREVLLARVQSASDAEAKVERLDRFLSQIDRYKVRVLGVGEGGVGGCAG